MFTHKKFEAIEMQLDDSIQETYDMVKSTLEKMAEKYETEVPRFVIAGGCLSNLYMGKSYRDIDVFIDATHFITDHEEEFESHFQPENFFNMNLGKSPEYEDFTATRIVNFDFKGARVEFIYCKNVETVYNFDYRFRQFYLYNDVIYATKGATDDAKKKRLFLESPNSPITTFLRGIYFEKTLGMKWDRGLKREVKWFMRLKYMSSEDIKRVENYIAKNKKFSDELKEIMLQEIQKLYKRNKSNGKGSYYLTRTRKVKSHLHDSVEKLLSRFTEGYGYKNAFTVSKANVLALWYAELKQYNPEERDTGTFYDIFLSDEEVYDLFAVFVPSIEKFVLQNRMQLLFDASKTDEDRRMYKEMNIISREKEGMDKVKALYQCLFLDYKNYDLSYDMYRSNYDSQKERKETEFYQARRTLKEKKIRCQISYELDCNLFMKQIQTDFITIKVLENSSALTLFKNGEFETMERRSDGGQFTENEKYLRKIESLVNEKWDEKVFFDWEKRRKELEAEYAY